MSNLLSELEAVVGVIGRTRSDVSTSAAGFESLSFLRTHHAEIAADAKDAARYRWLRDRVGVSHNGPMLPCGTWKLDDADKRATDAEIDKHIAAMSAREGEE